VIFYLYKLKSIFICKLDSLVVKHRILIEKCIKLKLKKNQVFKNKEIYSVEPETLKKIIDTCYCKTVSNKENEKLYYELGELVKLYSYTKNKINIRPYIVIDK